MRDAALGLDFGTTNTVLAWARPGGAATPVAFRHHAALLTAFRSALCFWDEGDEFVSIANGLATIGLRDDADAWAVPRTG